MHVCTCVHTCVCVCVHMPCSLLHAYVEARDWLQVSPAISLHFFVVVVCFVFEIEPLTKFGAQNFNWIGWPGASGICVPRAEITGVSCRALLLNFLQTWVHFID